MPKTRSSQKSGPARPIAETLLAWYDTHARDLPWRARPNSGGRLSGEGVPQQDPYAVWLSEIMLQQTTVATVGPYFQTFASKWPNVESLAAAPLDEVLRAWAGLGYYSRARNLHACARKVVHEHGGRFPADLNALQKLPGIGPYTAAAIAAIAFDLPATVVDGNVERVVSRLFAIETPLPAAKSEMKAAAATLTPAHRPGDFAQAMMDLGATICSPRSPSCGRCPISAFCLGRSQGIAETLPRKAPKKARPTRYGACFWLERSDGSVLLRQRPPKGLLGGMTEIPTTDWIAHDDGMPPDEDLLKAAPVQTKWRKKPGLVQHTFTHFHLELAVFTATVSKPSAREAEGYWVAADKVSEEALPTVMRKAVALATEDAGPLFHRP